MKKSSCKRCYWRGQCETGGYCPYFTPVDGSDEDLRKIMRKERRAFINEYEEYISECGDGFDLIDPPAYPKVTGYGERL